MNKLTRADLWSLENYAEVRNIFRQEVMALKKNRRLSINENIRFYFEDATTIKYQIQEMLRIERIFESEAIEEELASYNPLIPDGTNLKATLMLEFPDVNERAKQLTQLIDIETKVWLQVDGFEKIYPIADEDLERSDGEKTSSVHFLRFEFDTNMIHALKMDHALFAGSDHPNLFVDAVKVSGEVTSTLASDFNVPMLS